MQSNNGDASPAPADRRGGPLRREFRVSSKQFALTYPQCSVLRSIFDPIFRRLFKPTEYASAREQHADGNYHLHVFCAYLKRKDVQKASYFDVSIEEHGYHPNVQACRDRAAWLKYLSKEADNGVAELRRTDDGFNPLDLALGKRKSTYQDYLWSEQYRIEHALVPITWPIILACEGREYQMDPPDAKRKKRSWWIVAPPNAGKTRWINKTFANARIYVPRMGKYPFEGYGDQDIIIYDDRKGVGFEEFSDVLNTWCFQHPVFGEVRFTTQNWKMNHTRSVIVLSNKTIEQSMAEEDWQRMKKRFIQIVNPVLIPPGEESDDEEEIEGVPALASASEAEGFQT